MDKGINNVFTDQDSDEVLASRILEAQRTAPTAEEFYSKLKIREGLTGQFMKGEISGGEFSAKFEAANPKNGVIRCDNEQELGLCLLRMGFPRDEAIATVRHEKAHLDQAVSMGLVAHYEVQLGKTEREGSFAILPRTVGSFQEGTSDDQKKEIAKQVAIAPGADDLSDQDKLHLG